MSLVSVVMTLLVRGERPRRRSVSLRHISETLVRNAVSATPHRALMAAEAPRYLRGRSMESSGRREAGNQS